MKEETAEQLIEQTRGAYAAIAEDFSRTRARLWPALDLFKNYIKENDKILDIGCGNGRLINLIKDKKVDYRGIDYSAPLIDIAKENFPDYKFEVGNILNLDFPENYFDDILLIAVLHHIPSAKLREKAINNMYRILKPGGYVLMTNWNLWQARFLQYHIKYNWLRHTKKVDLDENDILREWGKTGNYRYVHAFTKIELDELGAKAGFETVKNIYVEYDGKETNFLHGKNILTVWKK